MKASEGVARLDTAIATGKAAIRSAESLFHGTLPPPPWPSPELYDAIDDGAELRERLLALVRGGDTDFDPAVPNVGRVVKEVERRAVLIETQAAKLTGRRDVVATRTPEAAARQIKQALGIGIPMSVIALVGVIWFLERK